mgnify:CR=1 FL=1
MLGILALELVFEDGTGIARLLTNQQRENTLTRLNDIAATLGESAMTQIFYSTISTSIHCIQLPGVNYFAKWMAWWTTSFDVQLMSQYTLRQTMDQQMQQRMKVVCEISKCF